MQSGLTTLVRSDTPCIACGYQLRGLATDGKCPECDTPIERSTGERTILHSDASHLAILRLGLLLIAIGYLGDILWLLLTPLLIVATGAVPPGGGALSFSGAIIISLFLDFATSLCTLFGWWCLTTKSPGETPALGGSRARTLMRCLLVFLASLAVVGLLGQVVPALQQTALGALGGTLAITPATVWSAPFIAAVSVRALGILAKLARFFVGLVLLRQLAQRIPSETLARDAAQQLWLVPACVTLGAPLFFLGPLYAVYRVVKLPLALRRLLVPASALR